MTTSSATEAAGGRIRRWRRVAEVAQGALVLGLPFVRVGGESALRFDVPTLRLHFLGTALWMDEFFLVLAGTLFLALAFLWATLAFGRLWCGWSCPQTLLSDLTAPLDRWRRRGGARAAAAVLGLAAVSALVGANLVWYFVSPTQFARELAAGTLGPVAAGSWAVLSAVVFLDLVFLRARFCATACPYARLQGALFDRHTLVVAYDRRRDQDCVDCGACVRVCPTGIDIRHGLQMECIACGDCIDACQPIMRKLSRAPDLVAWFWGEPGAPRRLLRPGVLALGGAAAAALLLTGAAAAARSALDLVASPASQFAPRLFPDGRAVNAYTVALENRGREPMVVRLALDAPGAEARVRPAQVPLAPGEHRRLTVLAEARLGPGTVQAELRAEGERARASRQVPFVVPEAP
ncbi:MAG TPA: 4Fe-4S dicluster domain-containing protein [Anaeromyxobacteraceae bacterium]|nr:4Fe-4S dicluster domain-containing protein [Anaeromyxobacteraceae bacterium]